MHHNPQVHGIDPETAVKLSHYYVGESCDIAVALLIDALQNVGLTALTSTSMGADRSKDS